MPRASSKCIVMLKQYLKNVGIFSGTIIVRERKSQLVKYVLIFFAYNNINVYQIKSKVLSRFMMNLKFQTLKLNFQNIWL